MLQCRSSVNFYFLKYDGLINALGFCDNNWCVHLSMMKFLTVIVMIYVYIHHAINPFEYIQN